MQNHGVPELVEMVDAGKLAVSSAEKIAREPVEKQRDIIARGEKEILQQAKKIRERKAEQKAQKKRELVSIIRSEPTPVPAGPFRVIVIDPEYEA